MNLLPILAIVGVVTGVHDGDTMRLNDGTRIRLAGIDANEMNGTCHNDCAPMSAAAARDNLKRLALGHKVRCDQTGTSYRRVVAWCRVEMNTSIEDDLSCAQVRAGAAVRWARYDPEGHLLRCARRGRWLDRVFRQR